jgi:hypothetical protein
MNAEETETVNAPCSCCLRKTQHKVLHSKTCELDEDGMYAEVYKLLQCAGCGTVSMANYSFSTDSVRECYRRRYYPSPVTRKTPPWCEQLPVRFGELFDEIYEAVRGGQYRLAAMGIRALFEQMMISKVGDKGTFEKNMDAFFDKGCISIVQRDAMKDVLEVGHAAIHRSFKPYEGELSTALDIIEGIFAAIYVHGEAAAEIAARVPPRPPRPKKPDD